VRESPSLASPDNRRPEARPAESESDCRNTIPENPGDVSRLNSMVNYFSRFLPNLSDMMKLLCELTHKDIEWCWSNAQERAWSEVKSLITSAPMLSYYKPN